MTEDDIREQFGITDPCCESCHQDTDEGFPQNTIEIEGQEISVCCAVARAYKRLQNTIEAIASEPGGNPSH